MGLAAAAGAAFWLWVLEAVCFPPFPLEAVDLDFEAVDLPPDFEFVAIKVHLREP